MAFLGVVRRLSEPWVGFSLPNVMSSKDSRVGDASNTIAMMDSYKARGGNWAAEREMSVSCVAIDMPWSEMNQKNGAKGKNKLRAKKWQANETADAIGVDVEIMSFTAEAFTDAPAARATKIPRPRPPPAKASAAAPAAPGDPQA